MWPTMNKKKNIIKKKDSTVEKYHDLKNDGSQVALNNILLNIVYANEYKTAYVLLYFK